MPHDGQSRPAARAAAALDLTRLTEGLGRPLPREMPVWGTRLYEDYPEAPGTEAVRECTVALMVDYLETIQAE